jgi:ABC-type branched-subunit amino acid transport system substrate-binding protein
MDRSARAWLLFILTTSLVLNLWGVNFGLPDAWHPDELVGGAINMARNFTLNPHEFRYGSLHFYQILAVIVPTYLVTDLLSLPEVTQKTAVYIAARALTAVFGAGCVALTFLLAHHLFGRMAAVLSALCLTLTVGFVNIAHFATTDIPMLFWMVAASLMSAYVLTSGKRKWYILAGVFAGFAAGTKYPGGIVLVNLIAAHLLSKQSDRDHASLLSGLLSSAISFLVVNPAILFASCEFFEGFIRDGAFHASFDKGGAPLLYQVLENLHNLMGVALASVVLTGIPYSIILFAKGKHRVEIGFVYAALIPFILVLSGVHFTTQRYAIPLLPALLILTGKMLADAIQAPSLGIRCIGRLTVLVVGTFSALSTIAGNLQFTYDSRKAAAAWINENAVAGSTIEVTPYGPTLPEERYVIVRRPRLRDLGEFDTALENARIYESLQPIYVRYRDFAEDVGFCEYRRPHYQGWYDKKTARNIDDTKEFDVSMEGLERRTPDLLVASSFYYDRYEGDPRSSEGKMFDGLFSGDSAYREVANMRYEFLGWLDPSLEFVNPTVRIFQLNSTDTGQNAWYGEQMERGAALAVADINAAGGALPDAGAKPGRYPECR